MAANDKKGLVVNPVHISTGNLRSLWETGAPLDDAWIAFTESFLDRFSLKMLRTHPSNDVGFADDPRFQRPGDWLPRTWEGREEKLKITREVERSHLLDELYAGRLWAIGFVIKPNGFDEPTRVPRDLFFLDYNRERPDQPQINWSKSELIGRGVSYFDIRVVRSPEQGEPVDDETGDHPVRAEASDESPNKPQTGRPSTKDTISAEVERLLDNPEFLKLPNRTVQAREVRARLVGEEARNDDDRIGYKTSVIARIIGEVITRPSE